MYGLKIYMKKGRPGVKLCCLARPDDTFKLSRIILAQTTTQGVRVKEYDRLRLNWKIEEAVTTLGKIHVKVTELDGKILRKVPEYEDLKELAKINDKPVWEIRNLISKEI